MPGPVISAETRRGSRRRHGALWQRAIISVLLAGAAGPVRGQAPVITTNPPVSSYELAPGGHVTLAATGHGAAPCSGYWQMNNGSAGGSCGSGDTSQRDELLAKVRAARKT